MSLNPAEANPHTWIESYGDLLYQYALPRVNDPGLAEDLVQETFLSGLKGLQSYKGEASEKNWLFAILKNKIIDHFRKKSREASVVTMPDLSSVNEEWFDEKGGWIPQKTPREWPLLEQKEIRRIINWCKDHLKNLQQHVFVLKYLEDLDSDEICKVLNISSSNYWVLIHRARLQMRECVEKQGFKNGGV